jgi:hypothetical protein
VKLHVAFDQHGNIVAAAEAGVKGAGDKPLAKPGLKVGEMEVPKEFSGKKFHEYVHRLHVDVGAEKLVMKR